MKRNVVCLILCAALAACSSMPDIPAGETMKYRTRGRLPAPGVPPDLAAPAREDRSAAPAREDRSAAPDAQGQRAVTLSTYSAERSGAPRAGTADLPPDSARVRIEKAGSQRWLVVPHAPERVWPIAREFWQELGFLLKTELPDAGVMETDWAENRAKIADDPIHNFLSQVFDVAYSTGERDKFRTRLERGATPDTTEISISHRGMVEVYKGDARESTEWVPRPPDPELEAVFLQRLMLRLGAEDARARSRAAGKDAATERVTLLRAASGGGDQLQLSEPFDRAWQRVGSALDRVGFTVEDRDRSRGYYFVRYVDPQIDAQKNPEKNRGLLSNLGARMSDRGGIRAEHYRVTVTEARSGVSVVQIRNRDGQEESSDTGRRILSLLHAQLK